MTTDQGPGVFFICFFVGKCISLLGNAHDLEKCYLMVHEESVFKSNRSHNLFVT